MTDGESVGEAASLPEPETTAGQGLIRDRIRERWPQVLLTLTSIIQALALETLFSEITEERRAVLPGPEFLILWLQVSCVLLVIVVVWLFYAQVVMRLTWVPELDDTLSPFALGVSQFILVDTIGSAGIGWWIAGISLPVAIAGFTSARILKKAARDPANELFFATVTSRGWTRQLPTFMAMMILIAFGVFIEFAGAGVVLQIIGLAFVNLILLGQLLLQRIYWIRSINLSDQLAQS